MYSRSLEKLSINKQFEKAIKEVAIDCELNKNGNIIRLEEMYTPNPDINDTWNLIYENYSTGDKYFRIGIKSATRPDLPYNIFTLDDILSGTAKNSQLFKFKNIATGDEIELNKSLIIAENIDCSISKYSFEFPQKIINLTFNKELTPFLFKMSERQLSTFLKRVQYDTDYRTKNIKDPLILSKIKKFMNTSVSVERQKYIEALTDYGYIGDESSWDQYTLEELRLEYKQIKKT